MGLEEWQIWFWNFGWIHSFVIGLLLLIIVLYETNKNFHFRCKYVFIDIVGVLGALIALPILICRGRRIENNQLAFAMIRWAYKVYGIQFEIRGRENLEAHKSYLMMANHQSKLDVIAEAHFMPPGSTTLAKRELLLYSGPFGLAMWLCKIVFVDRFNRERAIETMRETAKLIRDSGIRVLMFPEGTRNRNGNGFLAFKKGGFHLAVQGKLPIVPIVISNYNEWLNVPERRFLSHGRVIVTCLPPIVLTGNENVNELLDNTRRQMLETYQQTSAEISAYYAAYRNFLNGYLQTSAGASNTSAHDE